MQLCCRQQSTKSQETTYMTLPRPLSPQLWLAFPGTSRQERGTHSPSSKSGTPYVKSLVQSSMYWLAWLQLLQLYGGQAERHLSCRYVSVCNLCSYYRLTYICHANRRRSCRYLVLSVSLPLKHSCTANISTGSLHFQSLVGREHQDKRVSQASAKR